MVGVDRRVIEHKLMIKKVTQEVKQKKHVQGGDRNKSVNTEVAKLRKAGILFRSGLSNMDCKPSHGQEARSHVVHVH